MRLSEFFGMDEGARDEEFRQLAMDAATKVRSVLEKRPSHDRFQNDRGETIMVYDLQKLIPDDPNFEKLELGFRLVDKSSGKVGGAHMYFRSIDTTRIEIRFPNESSFDATGWKEYVEKNGAVLFEKNKTVFRHEFIHHLDQARLSPAYQAQSTALTLDRDSDYFNHPLELNAFAQMGMADFADKLKHVRTKDGALMLMGKTPQEFWGILQKSMHKGFLTHITPDNKRKLQKRSYQFWQDTMRKMK